MSKKQKTALEFAVGRLCVVIDWDEEGNHQVFADEGVVVFARNAYSDLEPLYRYTPPNVPRHWLDQPAGYKGDGSEAEMLAL